MLSRCERTLPRGRWVTNAVPYGGGMPPPSIGHVQTSLLDEATSLGWRPASSICLKGKPTGSQIIQNEDYATLWIDEVKKFSLSRLLLAFSSPFSTGESPFLPKVYPWEVALTRMVRIASTWMVFNLHPMESVHV